MHGEYPGVHEASRASAFLGGFARAMRSDAKGPTSAVLQATATVSSALRIRMSPTMESRTCLERAKHERVMFAGSLPSWSQRMCGRFLTALASRNTVSCVRRDSRLSGVLHLLLHMAQRPEPMTSEVLARSMDSNPVVVRRIMAGLREAGYVQSEKGHGGGWTLACDLSKVTLRDIYEALGSPSLLAIGNRTESPGCLVEAAVNAQLSESFHDAEELLLARFGEVTLAMLSDDVRARLAARSAVQGKENAPESTSGRAQRHRTKRVKA